MINLKIYFNLLTSDKSVESVVCISNPDWLLSIFIALDNDIIIFVK